MATFILTIDFELIYLRKRFNNPLTSIIFPQNKIYFLDEFQNMGFSHYRGIAPLNNSGMMLKIEFKSLVLMFPN